MSIPNTKIPQIAPIAGGGSAADLFTGPITLAVPPLADRFAYKKKSGSSDTAHTRDIITT